MEKNITINITEEERDIILMGLSGYAERRYGDALTYKRSDNEPAFKDCLAQWRKTMELIEAIPTH